MDVFPTPSLCVCVAVVVVGGGGVVDIVSWQSINDCKFSILVSTLSARVEPVAIQSVTHYNRKQYSIFHHLHFGFHLHCSPCLLLLKLHSQAYISFRLVPSFLKHYNNHGTNLLQLWSLP